MLGCAGDIPTLETLAAAALLREHLPDLKVRVVNVVDLMRLQPTSRAPARAVRRPSSTRCSRSDRPVIFAYHGYPWLIHRLTYRRTNHDNIHVRGYKEEGTTTTPFDMVMLNDLDRFHLVIDVIDRVPGLGERAAAPAPAHGRRAAAPPGLHARARRRPGGHQGLGLARLRATSIPACQPGARPPSGGSRRSAGTPAAAITQAMTEFEFHISPAWSSSRPHTGVARPATRSSTRRASRRIGGEPARPADRLAEVGDRPPAPAADLVAEDAQAREPAAADRAGGHHAAARLVGVRRGCELDGIALAVQLDHERGVVEVVAPATPACRLDGLEETAHVAHRVPAGAERDPVQIDRGAGHAAQASGRWPPPAASHAPVGLLAWARRPREAAIVDRPMTAPITTPAIRITPSSISGSSNHVAYAMNTPRGRR